MLKIKTPLILMLVSAVLFCADFFGGSFSLGNIIYRFHPCEQAPANSFPCQLKWDLQFLIICFWVFVASVLGLIVALWIRNKTDLVKKMWARILMSLFCFIAFFYFTSGTIAYWEGWVYLAILMIPMTFILIYFLKHDPELIERRMRMKEKELVQKWLMGFSWIFALVFFATPGLEHRYGLASVPWPVVLVADVGVLLGYWGFAKVLMANRYASRIIEVEKGQKVIETGPYAVIRHPMYTSVFILYAFTPLALGSWRALIFVPFLIPILVLRILNEEKVLQKELPAYKAYMKKVKYRLIPGIW